MDEVVTNSCCSIEYVCRDDQLEQRYRAHSAHHGTGGIASPCARQNQRKAPDTGCGGHLAGTFCSCCRTHHRNPVRWFGGPAWWQQPIRLSRICADVCDTSYLCACELGDYCLLSQASLFQLVPAHGVTDVWRAPDDRASGWSDYRESVTTLQLDALGDSCLADHRDTRCSVAEAQQARGTDPSWFNHGDRGS